MLLLVLTAAVVLGGNNVDHQAAQAAKAQTVAKVQCTDAIEGIGWYRSKTWRWQDKMDKARTPIAHRITHPIFRRACGYTRWTAKLWVKRAKLTRVSYEKYLKEQRRPKLSHLAGWLCIHSREGAWNANTGNGYYGGLQMTYGWMGIIKGRASDMTPAQQMAAAEGGYTMNGYSDAWMRGQWPNTYPPCAHLFG